MELNPAKWVEQYGDFLYRYALVRLRRAEAAEDVVQETFVGALRGRAGFKGDCSERTWLVSILKRKIIDRLRRKNREQPLGDLDADAQENDLFDRSGHWKKMPRAWSHPDAALERAEFWQAFSRCLGKLPPRMAEAFSLRELDGVDSVEVCKILAIKPSNLSVMLHRARLRLWQCLGINWFATEEQSP